MPLRCLGARGESIDSFDLSEDQWKALAHKNRTRRHLRMPCCSAQVILKKSVRGTPFFAHKAGQRCAPSPETEAHLYLKRLAVLAARTYGWMADSEVPGATPSGESWIADILAQKGKHKVAIEIQWSSQTNEETLQRQERYRQSGVRGLWLLRQPGFPVDLKLPAVCIGGNSQDGFLALIPHKHCRMNARDRSHPNMWHQVVPMNAFFDAVFARRFQFGIPLDVHATVSIQAAHMPCWRCHAPTRILTSVDVQFGPNEFRFTIPELGEHRELLRSVLDHLPGDLDIGEIKRRYSKTQQRSYMSNGCLRCDSLIGGFFETEANEREYIHTMPIRMSKQWRHAIEQHDSFSPAWSVYPAK